MKGSSDTRDELEVEWQFEAPDVAALAQWVERAIIPGYVVTVGPVKQLRDTYFDTPDWAVHRGGFTCRIRGSGESAELTLKSMAESQNGVRSRREMTESVSGDAARDPLLAPGGCGSALRLLAGRATLVSLFTLDQTRHVFYLDDAQGRVAEIAVDETRIPKEGEPPAIIGRLEIEIEAGALKRARRYASVLATSNGLRPASTSKFGAALATAELTPLPAAPDLGPTTVSAGMSTSEVAFAILRKQFAVFLANEPGTRLGEDIEALHDMRVAARRLRAALSAFNAYLPPRMQQFRLQLGRVAASLGEVRDLDVQLERAKEWEEALPERSAALEPVVQLLETRRQAARKRMLALLSSRWYELVVARFSATLRRGAPRTSLIGREPITATAPDLLERRYAKVEKRGKRITPRTPAADYHLLRIDAKKLRYALEFIGPIYGKRATDFASRVTALQDVLGDHQDAEVAIEALDAMATTARRLPPETLLAMGAVAERYRAQAVSLRKQFPAVFRPLTGKEWQALRKLIARSR